MKSGKSSDKSAAKKVVSKPKAPATTAKSTAKAKKTVSEPKKAAAKKTGSAQPVAETATPKTSPVKAAKKKTAKPVPPVPPILLEGDQPPAPDRSGIGERFSLGTVSRIGLEDHGELPQAYGTKKLLLAARDPHWLYARWDLTPEQQRNYNGLSVDRHLVVRVFINQAKGAPFTQVHVHPESTHWFIHVGKAATKYLAELGYYSSGGQWHSISTSGATMTPPDTMSDDVSADFATIPVEVPFTHLMELARTAVRENVPLAEVTKQLQASGYELPKAPGAESGWTPERERALAAIITMDQVRRVWMGSLEITELIRRQLQHEISSINAAHFSAPSSEMGSLSSISSPFGGAGEQGKGFWFNVNAELIIYGATEPDAEVTIGGRVIKLRQDGSFSYRFALPDGHYDLPAIATAADKSDSRAAGLKFSRSTQYRGEVGKHPQDAALKTPRVENVS